MEDGLNPDDTLPDEAFADTIAELESLTDATLFDTSVPLAWVDHVRRAPHAGTAVQQDEEE